MPLRSLLAAFLVTLAGCTPLGLWVYEEPTIEITSVRLTDAGAAEYPVRIALQVSNVNDFEVSLPPIDDHDARAATVTFTCAGSSAFTASWPGAKPSITLLPFAAPPALRLKLDPRKPGRVQAAVVFTYHWNDGHQEQARVLVSANVEVGVGVDGMSPKPQAVRLKEHVGNVDLGEHVVGGRETSDVTLPAMMDMASGKALVIYRVEGSPAITASWPGANHRGTHLDPMAEPKPLKVRDQRQLDLPVDDN